MAWQAGTGAGHDVFDGFRFDLAGLDVLTSGSGGVADGEVVAAVNTEDARVGDDDAAERVRFMYNSLDLRKAVRLGSSWIQTGGKRRWWLGGLRE